jgi:glycosyltransferase involved in cell wall biosynthesis
MKTKLPSAIIYNFHTEGEIELTSQIYWEESLFDGVVLYSIPFNESVVEDYTKYRPDLIISVGEDIHIPHNQLKQRYIKIDEGLDDAVIANIIACQTVFRNCKVVRPKFSIFTPVYKTGSRILRTYRGLLDQSFYDWEWVVVDDSPDDETWRILKEIESKDYRVKLHRISPVTGGNVGLAKHRAAMLCDGDWLIELDHDDYLTNQALSTLNDAIEKYPDAKFLYSDCSEIYDDGGFKTYDHKWDGDWYGREDNYFDFGYAGHSLVKVDDRVVVAHHYPDINPLTIRFNISMPNHVRVWERNLYHEIGGHNKHTPVADDFEIIVRTFLKTKMVHIKKVLYFQYNNRNSTVDNNSQDINRRARLIRDYYDNGIHNRIIELGFEDWCWDEERKHSHKFQNHQPVKKFYDEEQVMNYIYE